jgi:hypothetical protein
MSVKSTIRILLNLHLYNQELYTPGSWTEFGELKRLAQSLYKYPQFDMDFSEALQDFDDKAHIEVHLDRCRITEQGRARAIRILSALTDHRQSRPFDVLIAIAVGVIIGLLIGIYFAPPVKGPPTLTSVSNPLGVDQSISARPISVGCWVVVVIDSRVRRTPGYINKPLGDECTWLAQGDMVQVTDGPRYADGLTWWEVKVASSDCEGNRGWIAEWNRDGKQMLQRQE